MSYSPLSVLRKAGQLLRYQYIIDNENTGDAPFLKSYLSQAIDEVLQETDWVYAIKFIELAPDGDSNNLQYGYPYSFKLPNDCVRHIGVYPFYLDKNTSSYTNGDYVYGFSGLSCVNHFTNKIITQIPSKRIGNVIATDVDKILLEYVSNDPAFLANVNEIWFVNLIAYKLAAICASMTKSTEDYKTLEREYTTTLNASINKNAYLKEQIKQSGRFDIYPYNKEGMFY